YFAGIESFLQVQIAEVEYFTALRQQVRTVFETFANRINFYKALGGGWDDATPGAQYDMNRAMKNAVQLSDEASNSSLNTNSNPDLKPF
ncbi:MAG: hypothetical protein NWS57_06500, partial [Burkholderiaceae bacterium]|nr:hypothetical protein [Burkholderiaceae bacterium]